MRTPFAVIAVALAGAVSLASCRDRHPRHFRGDLQAVLDRHALVSLAAAVIDDGEVVARGAVGVLDRTGEATATSSTIYAVASCAKPVIGLVAARLMDRKPGLDLDADIGSILGWSVRHPRHPAAPVTLRHLMTHTSGLSTGVAPPVARRPRPDPTVKLQSVLQETIARPDSWRKTAPGERYGYSNTGSALAALVLQAHADVHFARLSEREVFDPLRMNDTRWFFRDLDAGQRTRTARPHDRDREPLDHYGFDDYPSGQLRSSLDDLIRLLLMFTAGGETDDGVFLSAGGAVTYETTPLLMPSTWSLSGRVFEHAGNTTGVVCYLRYRSDGSATVYLSNTDLDDSDRGELHRDIMSTLEEYR